jgi:hypothetical protein
LSSILNTIHDDLSTLNIGSEAFFDIVESKLDELVEECKQLCQLLDIALRADPCGGELAHPQHFQA